MKIMVAGIVGVVFMHVSLSAQVSPVPVADLEVRDATSIRMRSLEIERAKRNANKSPSTELSKENENRLARISQDFGTIQKLQLSIVEAYTTGRTINYGRISESAIEMRKRAIRFGADFFNTKKEPRSDDDLRKPGETVRDLVIELDNAIYKFLGSPVFNKAIVDTKSFEKAQFHLLDIMALSQRLSNLAQSHK